MREWSSKMSRGRGWSVIAYVCCDLGRVTNSVWSSVGNYSEIIVNLCQGMTYFMGRGSYIWGAETMRISYFEGFLKIWCQLMYSFSNTSLWLHAFALIFVSMSCFPLNGKGLKISYTEWLSFSLCQLKVWIVLKTQRLHACDHMVRKQIFKCTYTEYF